MPDGSTENSIPAEVRTLFEKIVIAFDHACPGLATLEDVSYEGRDYPVGRICDFVMAYSGTVAEEVYERVCEMVPLFERAERLGYSFKPPRDHSYAAVAECFYNLYVNREYRYYGYCLMM
jgi:hypothetical protein